MYCQAPDNIYCIKHLFFCQEYSNFCFWFFCFAQLYLRFLRVNRRTFVRFAKKQFLSIVNKPTSLLTFFQKWCIIYLIYGVRDCILHFPEGKAPTFRRKSATVFAESSFRRCAAFSVGWFCLHFFAFCA